MKKLLYLFILLCFGSCEKKIEHEHGFYYWRSKFSLNKEETKLLNQSKVENLYTRFFDIQKSGSHYEAVGILQRKDTAKINKKIVPVIFITNETWYKIPKQDVTLLAQKSFDQVNAISKNLNLDLANEIQIDSDWTKGTKDDYFFFLLIICAFSSSTFAQRKPKYQLETISNKPSLDDSIITGLLAYSGLFLIKAQV